MLWIAGSAVIAGLWILAAIGWKSGWITAGTTGSLLMLSATGFLLWGTAGANWVLRARQPTVAGDVAELRRMRRRLYLCSSIPAGVFLWDKLTEIFASADSLAEVILLSILAVAIAVGYAWVWVALFSRFMLVVRK